MSDSVISGHCGQPIKVQDNPELWEVVVDYYPESRSFIEYYFNTEKEAIEFCENWKKNESNSN